MKIFAILASLLAVTTALPSGGGDIQGASVVTFEGPVKPGGDDIKITGDAKEIYEKLRELNPNYDADFKNELAPPRLEARIPAPGSLFCNNWPQLAVSNLHEGIQYLLGLNGKCYVGAGAGKKCIRVSCSWSAAIWLCNDNKNPIGVPCREIGGTANHIAHNCHGSSSTIGYVSGHMFKSGKWNVIVREGNC
ncbi:hypothetical protein GX51_01803 [Blastomyces parvus]|uniref:Uncharacterized protein n=1 Tax=Blastomyces parvus TaxID=2060905 RepID=A0A2B7XFJ3_9EURO|nr:hypothetical protein GX51_01803 [Blastomyces parvus]